MAAAYETGTATSPTDLLQKLVTWLVAQGWTSNMSASDASGWRAHLSKGGAYVNMRAAINESIWASQASAAYGIGLYTGTGYSGAANWRSQAGRPVYSGSSNTCGAAMQLDNGAVTAYHFVDDGSDNITVVVERSAGVFTWMGWGALDKTGAGTYTGGRYFFAALPSYVMGTAGTYPGVATRNAPQPFGSIDAGAGGMYNGYFTCDIDTWTGGKWVGVGLPTTSPSTNGYTGWRALSSCMCSASGRYQTDTPHWNGLQREELTNGLDGRNVLVPINLFAVRTSGTDYSFVGSVPAGLMLSAACLNGVAAAATISYGGANYKVFPGAWAMTADTYTGIAVRVP